MLRLKSAETLGLCNRQSITQATATGSFRVLVRQRGCSAPTRNRFPPQSQNNPNVSGQRDTGNSFGIVGQKATICIVLGTRAADRTIEIADKNDDAVSGRRRVRGSSEWF